MVLAGMQLNRHAQYKLSRSYGVTISLIFKISMVAPSIEGILADQVSKWMVVNSKLANLRAIELRKF